MSDFAAGLIAGLCPLGILASAALVDWWEEHHGPVAAAVRARNAMRDALIVQFLTYGYDQQSARVKADAHMDADARAAEAVR